MDADGGNVVSALPTVRGDLGHAARWGTPTHDSRDKVSEVPARLAVAASVREAREAVPPLRRHGRIHGIT